MLYAISLLLFAGFYFIHRALEKLMTQQDDVQTSIDTLTADTQTAFADIAAAMAVLKQTILDLQGAQNSGGVPIDLAPQLAALAALDALVKANDPGTSPAPTSPSPATP